MTGVQEPFLYKMTGFVADWMKPAYPEMLESIAARRAHCEGRGTALRHHVPGCRARVPRRSESRAQGGLLPGPAAFRLYDTFGLALDEQEEMAREFGLAIDREGFEAEMERQRERARASWKGAEKAHVAPVYQELLAQGRTKFLGYDGTEHEAPSCAA